MKKITGLTSEQVNKQIELGHINTVVDSISKTKKQILKEHTLTYFNFLNLFLAFIIILSGKVINITFIFVIITNTILGIIQEFKVKKIIDALTVVTVKKVKTLRDGVLQDIATEHLVLGDVIFIESGNQIGTDCTVLESDHLELNESMLTGESKPVVKSDEDELLSGSFVVAGSGYAKVIRVGKDNYSTQLVSKAKHKNKASSEMRDSIERIIKVLSIIIVPVGFILFYSQLQANPNDVSTAIVKTVGGVIGMIPEGLVLLTSLSFVIGVGRLAKKRALIQQMEAIEALARVNVLCLDKTGTITTGALSVKNVLPLNNYTQEEVNSIMGVVAYSSNDVNMTQQALMDYFIDQKQYKVLNQIPFSSERKYRAILVDNQKSYILGAPEYLLEKEDPILKTVDNYSLLGMRVLLLGESSDVDFKKMTYKTLTPVSIIVISDVIRDEAKDTFAFFEKNNVEVKILSGDNPLTVSRVCLQAGLKKGDQYIDASTLPDTIEELAPIVKHYNVFGRVKPEQKQLIIKAFQYDHKVVGMVGDGVNDVLAIKDADCGIAMAAGSDAAKQAAHIVLLDSSFSSMKEIVNEGRTIIANIERVSSLYLTKTIYSTVLCCLFAIIQLPYPFTPLQLSLISGLAIGIPSFLLTLEKKVSLNSFGFLQHVIKTALPCALTMITHIIAITVLGHYLNFNGTMFSTYYFLVAGFISFMVVYIVSRPLTMLREILVISVTVCFYFILFFLPSLFGIYPMFDIRVIWVIPLCLSAVLILQIYSTLVSKIYVYIESRKRV